MTGYGQQTFNMELVASVDNGENGNDIWGYVDSTGLEYAIMGTRTTTKIWSLEDPANPIERASIPGPAGIWRDIKSFEDHIYVTSDQGTDGLLIIDMSQAPEIITSDYWKPSLIVDSNITIIDTFIVNFDSSIALVDTILVNFDSTVTQIDTFLVNCDSIITQLDTFIVITDTISMTMDTVTLILDTIIVPKDTITFFLDTVIMPVYTITSILDTILMPIDTITLLSDTLREPLNKCHNLYIDTDQGYCYLSGCNISAGGILILDLNQDKKNPVHVGSADIAYSHDVYVKNDLMYTSEIFLGMFNVYDISDKTNPILLNGERSSFNFTHNTWLSDDGNYLFTTDERPNAYVESFDISDLDAIEPLDRFQSLETAGLGVIPHNTHYLNGFLITSWYSDGVIITDVNEPDNMIKVAAFDSEATSEGGNGCWGVYPFLPSGLILASDGNGLGDKLKIYRPITNSGEQGFQRASYLKGNITDANTGFGIPNVDVVIMSSQQNKKSSRVNGGYKTGVSIPGTFQVMYTHPNYDSVIAEATLVSGEITILDIQMGQYVISGTVVDKLTGEGIANANVVLFEIDNKNSLDVTTDIDGNWEMGIRTVPPYALQVAKWGYLGSTQDIISENGGSYQTELETGYQDDFFTDLGWTVSGDATTGQWELAVPPRTNFQGNIIQNDLDIPTDIGNKYYVSGASGLTYFDNDIDNGSTILTSPMMDFSGDINRIDISYYLWFINIENENPANDDVVVEITNGITSYTLSTWTQSSSEWSDLLEFTISSDDIEFNDQMQIVVTAKDDDPGHVAEAGIDAFNAFGYLSTGTGNLKIDNLGLVVFPNPTSDYIYLNSSKLLDGNNVMIVTDNTGKVCMTKYVASTTERYNIQSLTSGIYNIQVVGSEEQSETIRIVKN